MTCATLSSSSEPHSTAPSLLFPLPSVPGWGQFLLWFRNEEDRGAATRSGVVPGRDDASVEAAEVVGSFASLECVRVCPGVPTCPPAWPEALTSVLGHGQGRAVPDKRGAVLLSRAGGGRLWVTRQLSPNGEGCAWGHSTREGPRSHRGAVGTWGAGLSSAAPRLCLPPVGAGIMTGI